jgi:hypothetical protein
MSAEIEAEPAPDVATPMPAGLKQMLTPEFLRSDHYRHLAASVRRAQPVAEEWQVHYIVSWYLSLGGDFFFRDEGRAMIEGVREHELAVAREREALLLAAPDADAESDPQPPGVPVDPAPGGGDGGGRVHPAGDGDPLRERERETDGDAAVP